jgi:hypothetical protein
MSPERLMVGVSMSDDALVAKPIGALVGAVMNSASSWFWASEGFGRRQLYLFERGLLVLETDLRGNPFGSREWLRRFGDASIGELPDHVEEFARLNPRNRVIHLDDLVSARLSSRRVIFQILRLDLTLRDGRRFSFHWSPTQTYLKAAPDGSLSVPKRPYEAALADVRGVFAPCLSEPTAA